MTRILHLNHTGAVSGAEHSLLTLMAVLHERHELLLAAPAGDLLSRAADLGVRGVRVRGSSASRRLHPRRTPRAVVQFVRAGVAIRRLARAHEIEVIHANSVRAGLIAAVARCLGGPPFVVHVRDTVRGGGTATFVRAVIARLAAHVVVVSDFVAADWTGDVSRIHNPIDCERFRPDAADGRRWRRQAAIADDAPLLAVVGQITPWKRQLLAVDAVAELRATHPDAQLVIAGEVKFAGLDTTLDNPGYLRQLEARVHERGLGSYVRLLGEREDVPSLLRAADVLLAPAQDEPFGRAVGEALATGTPAVIAARGGTVEFLRDGVDGIVVDEGGDWAGACRRALELAADQGGAAQRRTHACSVLSKDAHAAALEALLGAAAR